MSLFTWVIYHVGVILLIATVGVLSVRFTRQVLRLFFITLQTVFVLLYTGVGWFVLSLLRRHRVRVWVKRWMMRLDPGESVSVGVVGRCTCACGSTCTRAEVRSRFGPSGREH